MLHLVDRVRAPVVRGGREHVLGVVAVLHHVSPDALGGLAPPCIGEEPLEAIQREPSSPVEKIDVPLAV